MRAEQVELPTAFAQAQAMSTMGDRPLVVLTAKANVDSKPGWAAAQDQMAALSTNSRHTVADMDHVGFLHNPVGAAQSVTAITDVVTAARDPRLRDRALTSTTTPPVRVLTSNPQPSRSPHPLQVTAEGPDAETPLHRRRRPGERPATPRRAAPDPGSS